MKTSRNTIQRNLVLQAVRTLHHHPTAEEVHQETVKHHPNISKGTVYRNLNLLAQRGEILKVEIPGGADHFDFNVAEHYHAYCRVCGSVCDVDMPYLDGLLEAAQGPQGFQLEAYTVVFKGICPNCRNVTTDSHINRR